MRMNDLCESIVILRGLGEDRVIVAVGRRVWVARGCLEENWHQQRGKDLTPGSEHKRGYASRVAEDEVLVGSLLLLVIAVRGKVHVEPATVREVAGIHREFGAVDHPEVLRKQRLPHRIAEYFSPADGVATAFESGVHRRATNGTTIGIIRSGVSRAWRSEVECMLVRERKVFPNGKLRHHRRLQVGTICVEAKILVCLAKVLNLELLRESVEKLFRLSRTAGRQGKRM